MCFTTATVLLAIEKAEKAFGLEFDKGRKQQPCARFNCSNPDFSYVYAMGHRFRTRLPINRPAGSLARSQVCNAALRALW